MKVEEEGKTRNLREFADLGFQELKNTNIAYYKEAGMRFFSLKINNGLEWVKIKMLY